MYLKSIFNQQIIFLKFVQNIQAELEGFEQLFNRYLLDNVDQPSIDWQEIQPPPEGTVR